MTLAKWQNRPMFSEWFDPFLMNTPRTNTHHECGCAPATNISETDEHFLIEMAAPGRMKEDFDIKLEKEMLSISTEKKETDDEKASYNRREFSADAFSRTFIIPKSVDVEKIVADYVNGVLSITLPKREDARVSLTRQISIN